MAAAAQGAAAAKMGAATAPGAAAPKMGAATAAGAAAAKMAAAAAGAAAAKMAATARRAAAAKMAATARGAAAATVAPGEWWRRVPRRRWLIMRSVFFRGKTSFITREKPLGRKRSATVAARKAASAAAAAAAAPRTTRPAAHKLTAYFNKAVVATRTAGAVATLSRREDCTLGLRDGVRFAALGLRG